MVKLVENDGYFYPKEDVKVIIQSIADRFCSNDEIVYIGIKGAFKEYLLATNKRVYIYKQGFMTGHTFGYSIFQLDYEAISVIQIHRQFAGAGYIEIVGIGMENRENISYWKTNKENSASHKDNCLSFGNNSDSYSLAVTRINDLMNRSRRKDFHNKDKETMNKFDEIKQFKELLDAGIISEDEFLRKKEELLNS